MKPRTKYTVSFNLDWVDRKEFPDWWWLNPVRDDKTKGYCTLCLKKFDISHGGRNDIKKHGEGQNHKQNLKHRKSLVSISDFQKTPTPTSATTSNPDTSSVVVNTEPSSSSSNIGQSESSATSSLFITPLVKSEALKAEVIWALDCVKKHRSVHSCDDQAAIFQAMFPSCPIAWQFQMAKDKLSYAITFGLAPHFQKETSQRVNNAPQFSISFDEAMNRVIQKGQLDVCIRYFSTTTNLTCTEYLTSVFLGHAKSDDLMSAVSEALGDITRDFDLSKLLQISMDGPNVNLRFYKDFIQQYERQFERKILQTGVCSLHVLSGALKDGMNKTSWGLSSTLRAMYTLFKDSPARRADYISITGSCKFPKSFCKIRWVENKQVCERAVEVLPHLRKYCSEVKPKPTVDSFSLVSEAILKDQYLEAKINLFGSLATQFEPFLRRFQHDKPMMPFLFDYIFVLLLDLLKRFLRPEIYQSVSNNYSKVCHLDLNDESNFRDASSVDIGFGAKRAVPKSPHPRML
jgi:hypothetical protein